MGDRSGGPPSRVFGSTLPMIHWKATPATEELRRTYSDPDFDDADWAEADVPGPAPLTDGTVLSRTTFDAPNLEADQRAWLVLDGVMYQGDWWLDGDYLGDTEGWWCLHRFEVTDQAARNSSHVLAAELSAPGAGEPKRHLTGALADPRAALGLWRLPDLRLTGPAAITHARIVCADAEPARATLALRAVLDLPHETLVTLRTQVASVDHVLEHQAAAGENQVNWTVTVDQPELWWPHGWGEPVLHDLTLEVIVGGQISDRISRRVGFRSVTWDRGVVSINGRRRFLTGIERPPEPWMPESIESHRDRLEGWRSAGVTLIRVRGHVAPPEFYDAADQLGLLIWQELPLSGRHHRSVRRPAVTQARELVDRFGHHPSILLWCCHDRPSPTNRVTIDRFVARQLRRCDGSRPVLLHPPPRPNSPTVDALARQIRHIPRLGQFVTGAVAQPRRAAEALRRLAYRPAGGFALAARPDELAPALAPVIVVADPLPERLGPGEAFACDLHVVSDLAHPLAGAEVRARLSWEGDAERYGWRGEVPADGCVRVATIQAIAPSTPGPLVLDLELTHPDLPTAVVNRYTSVVS